MSNKQRALPINLEAVNSFWLGCFESIQVHSDSALFGEQNNTGLIPPTFQYSENRSEATERAHAVLNGQVNSISTPESDFTEQGVGLPEVGDMSIICDGDGMPTALLSDTDVRIERGPHGAEVVETFEVLYPR